MAYYLDTNAFLKLTILMEYKKYQGKEEQGVNETRALVHNNANHIIISEWTLLEGLAVLTKCIRKDIFGSTKKKKKANTILNKVHEYLKYNKINVIPVDEKIYRIAIEMVQSYALLNLSSNDALHIAIVEHLQNNVSMVSSDRVLINICQSRNIPFFNPENNPIKEASLFLK